MLLEPLFQDLAYVFLIKKMNSEEQFKNDQLRVLDLLARRFTIEFPKGTKSNAQISIYPKDLKYYKFSVDVFGELLMFILNKEESMYLVSGYDEDDTYELDRDMGEVIENPCFIVLLPKDFCEIKERLVHEIKHEIRDMRPKIGTIEFDSLNNVLRCGNIIHAFQKNPHGNSLNLKLFRNLWDNARQEGEKNKKKGQMFPLSVIACQIDLVASSKDYESNKKMQNKLNATIKALGRMLRNKKFPAYIERKSGGLQLVITK